jgi:branched-subunit amino acid aminotransferase/4-amino-4-deoxychorismate lyase
LFWYNGQFFFDNKLEIRSDDPALLYGASAFTTLRVYDRSLENRLTSWLAHYHRLSQTINDLAWEAPDWQRVEQGIKVLLPYYDVIRVAIFPDGREYILGRHLPIDLPLKQSRGISASIVEDFGDRRTLPTHKTGNYLASWMALNRAKKIGADEAIFLDCQGNWCETATGNLWGWRDGQWWTPSLNGKILPGIRRAELIQCLSGQNLPVAEVVWSPSFVAGLEALAYTNCVVEVVPIHTVWHRKKSTAYSIDSTAIAQLRSFFIN